MTTTLEVDLPPTLFVRGNGLDAVRERSLFLLALKYFELGELTSGQAANLCTMGRVAFLAEAARYGVAAIELAGEEFAEEFR